MTRYLSLFIVFCLFVIVNSFVYTTRLTIKGSFLKSTLPKSKYIKNIQFQSFALYSSDPSKSGDARGPRRSKVPKDDVVEVKGRVVESLPNAMFRVEIEPSKQVVLTTISGKIRKNSVRILVGDSVVCELSAYDLTRGRITFRNK